MEFKKIFNKSSGLILGLVIVIGVTYFLGFQSGINKTGAKILYKDNPEISADFSLFWKAWDTFRQNYLRSKNVTDQQMLYGAISGMVNSGSDPYTVFFPPTAATSFDQNLNGNFGGIGAEIDIKSGQLIIVSPLKDTPAYKAGLKANDKILKINATSTDTIATVEEAVNIIRGEKGTTVKLSILRDGWNTPQDFSIVRDTITVPTLDWEMKPGKIAYMHLYSFNESASLDFYKAALPAMLEGAKGIVLDLRGNPGGYLDAATNIAGWFLNNGDVVTKEAYSNGQEDVLKAAGNSALVNLPVVVLVDSGSASASEILAGALRDDRQVKLIGDKTFGKGTVQEIKKFDDGSEMKVTIAQWLTPSGQAIDKKGLVPDITVQITADDAKNSRDPQLDKALEVIKSEIK